MKSSSERASLLAARKVPSGGKRTKCRIETDGTTIGIIITRGISHSGLTLHGIEELKLIIEKGLEFLKIAEKNG